MPCGLLLASAVACESRQQAAPRPSSVPVSVAAASRKDVPVELKAIGSVEASSTIEVRPQVGGVITEVAFSEGGDLRAGDPLFTIDPRPFEATLAAAEAALAKDEAQARNAALEAERSERLLSEGIVSQELADQARTTRNAVEAQVRADRAAAERARLDLSYTRIASPIDGRAGSLLVHQGNLVKAIDGGPLVTINRVEPIYVTFSVPEQRLPEIERAVAARTTLVHATPRGDAASPSEGRVSFVDNSVDRSTGTIRLRATFPNRERRLWPGQFVTVRLELARRVGATVIPAEAVQTGQSGTFVFVVKTDMTVEIRPVTVSGEAGDEVIVEKGLAEGESVVTDGQLRLAPGASVTIEQPAAPAARTKS
jgi:multidrug efflux system membrane fusion protein